MRLLRAACLLLAVPGGVTIPAAAPLLQPLSAGAATAVGAGLTAAWAAYTSARSESGLSPFAAAGSAAVETAQRAALAAGETALSAQAAASKALDMAVAQSALDNLGKILEVMSKKAEMEAKEIFSNPENPLNPETLIQRTRDLQTGFEEQIKSASGGMLDLGTWRKSVEEGLTPGAAIDFLKDRNKELEAIGVPGAKDRDWVVDQLDALARLTGNGPKSSTINIDDGVPGEVPTNIDISFDEDVEAPGSVEIGIDEAPAQEIEIGAEEVTPDETGGAQSIDIGAMPTSDRIVASSSSSVEIASSAAVGLGVGLGTSLGVGTAMWLYRRRAERAQVGVAGVSLGRSSTGFSK